MKRFKKTLAALLMPATVLVLLTGCLQDGPAVVPTPSPVVTPTPALTPTPAPTPAPTATPASTPGTTPDTSQKALLSQIRSEAENGRTINCEYPLKSDYISIENDWGTPDSSEYVAELKGQYALYGARDTAFGFNKGAQVFEVHSFDNRLKQLRLSAAKTEYGMPPHDVTTAEEKVVGYYAGTEYRLLLVFPKPTAKNPDPALDHYSVFYPAGTVNMMADDPGREW